MPEPLRRGGGCGYTTGGWNIGGLGIDMSGDGISEGGLVPELGGLGS